MDNHQGASHDHLLGNIGHLVESDHDSAPLPAETTSEKAAVDSRALVALPDGTLQLKSKRSDMAQRRIRRPFSVSEVEALVQAVEELGTGRYAQHPLFSLYALKLQHTDLMILHLFSGGGMLNYELLMM